MERKGGEAALVLVLKDNLFASGRNSTSTWETPLGNIPTRVYEHHLALRSETLGSRSAYREIAYQPYLFLVSHANVGFLLL